MTVSAETIRACTEAGIPIHFMSSRGTPYASLYSAGLTGTVKTRRAQLAAYESPRGVALALAFVLALEPKNNTTTNDPEPTLAEQYEALSNDADTVRPARSTTVDSGYTSAHEMSSSTR